MASCRESLVESLELLELILLSDEQLDQHINSKETADSTCRLHMVSFFLFFYFFNHINFYEVKENN